MEKTLENQNLRIDRGNGWTDGFPCASGQALEIEGLEPGEDIKKFIFFSVFPDPFGVLNQKNLFPKLIYQFEHLYQ